MQEADTGAVASTKTSSGMDKALAYVKDSFQSLRNMDKRQVSALSVVDPFAHAAMFVCTRNDARDRACTHTHTHTHTCTYTLDHRPRIRC